MSEALRIALAATFLVEYLKPLKLSKSTQLVARYLKHRRDYKTDTVPFFIATIANRLGLAERTVQYALRKLEDVGYLTVEHRQNRASVFSLRIYAPVSPHPELQICTPKPENLHPKMPKFAPPYKERLFPPSLPIYSHQRASAREAVKPQTTRRGDPVLPAITPQTAEDRASALQFFATTRLKPNWTTPKWAQKTQHDRRLRT